MLHKVTALLLRCSGSDIDELRGSCPQVNERLHHSLPHYINQRACPGRRSDCTVLPRLRDPDKFHGVIDIELGE